MRIKYTDHRGLPVGVELDNFRVVLPDDPDVHDGTRPIEFKLDSSFDMESTVYQLTGQSGCNMPKCEELREDLLDRVRQAVVRHKMATAIKGFGHLNMKELKITATNAGIENYAKERKIFLIRRILEKTVLAKWRFNAEFGMSDEDRKKQIESYNRLVTKRAAAKQEKQA